MSASTSGLPRGCVMLGTTWFECRCGLSDPAVATLAERDDQVLLTQDTDFGAIALKHGSLRTGVVIVRASVTDIDRLARRLVRLIGRAGGHFRAAITVLDDRGVRSRPIG